MESIRWVLGESSAREMRGDSMQDVIFNGSGNRKPVSRASVELIFDNSLGGAAGEWSQYAEISVKRVLQRDSGSTYYLNNTPVRRRDVADLFLGTGLGGRAYAIIGQNTISRIVEAKPEELRVFLEEAAGISKYKERRRETELRLRDTRDNLLRVEDIQREIAKQIERLEAQAMIAQQYHALREQLQLAEARAWLLKKRDAAQSWEKARRQVERLVNDLEAQTAALRNTELQLEQLRQQQQAASEHVQVAQGRFYEANAEVASLEQQRRHLQENRSRLAAQLDQLLAEQHTASRQESESRQQLRQLELNLDRAGQAVSLSEQALQSKRAQLPQAETAWRDAQAAFSQIQSAIQQAEQQIQLESSHLEHAKRSEAGLAQRLQALAQEEARLVIPDGALIAENEQQCDRLQRDLEALEQALARDAEQELAQSEAARLAQKALQQQARTLAEAEAHRAALGKLQRALSDEGKLEAWLKQAALDIHRRLWQRLTVEAGCERALEGLLGSRLNAILGAAPAEGARPPVNVVLYDEAEAVMTGSPHAAGWRSLLDCVQASDPAVSGILQDWLANAWLLPPGENMDHARQRLNPGEVLVNAAGDVATRYGMAFHAGESGLQGVLERQRELGELAASLPLLKTQLQQAEQRWQHSEQALHELRRATSEKQQALRQATAVLHSARMELQRMQQQLQHAIERQQQLGAERARCLELQAAARAELIQHQAKIETLKAGGASLQMERDQAGKARLMTEHALKQLRDSLQEAERTAQQHTFSKTILLNNINELSSRLNLMVENIARLIQRQQATQSQLNALEEEPLKAQLQQALERQRAAEQTLAEARDGMAAIEQQRLECERSRFQSEQSLHPLRDKLEQGRLQEQQVRLYFEQCRDQLAETGLVEVDLEQGLEKSAKAHEFENKVRQLQEAIAALGAVNLAAIQELAGEQERKHYLDRQATDLTQASATLEEAIRRIDRETRSRLQQTYDDANRHFNELFVTLFGGGQAQLQLLGEEILDTGIQVFAQPPGKKNSTIHLLSGGEKALTALALVFALFRLNPAPFCLMDEVDAPLDDSNTERFCALVRTMSERTQFLFVSHNKITMEMAQQLVGVTMQESGVSRIVQVDIEAAMRMQTEVMA